MIVEHSNQTTNLTKIFYNFAHFIYETTFSDVEESLTELYRDYFGNSPEWSSEICGSASSRKYFRLGDSEHSVVGVIGEDLKENAAFIALSDHFHSAGMPVPKVLAKSRDGRSYIQEDLGDLMLADLVDKARQSGDFNSLMPLLKQCMRSLAKLQFEGAAGLDFNVCYPLAAFDRRAVMFDLNYFKYCFLKPSGLEFDEMALQDDFESLSDDLLSCGNHGRTFLYRDFQSRNVMVRDGKPYFIDFQSGRRGPVYYDLASFVYQVRAAYPQYVKDALVDEYFKALKRFVPDVRRNDFDKDLRLFRLFRMMQVLGAYGFRGVIEHKSKFVTSLIPAVRMLGEFIQEPFEAYPYLTDTLRRLSALEKYRCDVSSDGVLEVKVYSFSYKKGIPEDWSGNGGGYVFDCRSIHNPGKYEQYKNLTGLDEPVIRFLEDDGEILEYLNHVYGMVDNHVRTFLGRGFTNLSVCFGCTGGQHRSVYCAEHTARHLAAAFPSTRIRLIHRERGLETLFNV